MLLAVDVGNTQTVFGLFDSSALTQQFRVGTDQLLIGSDGKSWISFEDYAVALADELGLIWTGSSDCHGTRYNPVRLGMRTTGQDQFERLRVRAEELRAGGAP